MSLTTVLLVIAIILIILAVILFIVGLTGSGLLGNTFSGSAAYVWAAILGIIGVLLLLFSLHRRNTEKAEAAAHAAAAPAVTTVNGRAVAPAAVVGGTAAAAAAAPTVTRGYYTAPAAPSAATSRVGTRTASRPTAADALLEDLVDEGYIQPGQEVEIDRVSVPAGMTPAQVVSAVRNRALGVASA